MVREADAVVIGAGPGGYVAAIRLGQLGVDTVLVERDKLGGECLNYGCIPSKALIHVGNLVHHARQAAEMGVLCSDLSVDMGKLQGWKNGVVDRLTKGIGKLCEGNGVDVVMGHATFVSPHEVEIRGEGKGERIRGKQFLLATGGRPVGIPGFAFDGERILSTKEALEVEDVPEEMVVVGGGVSGLELGTFFAKVGTKVTVIELLDQLLPGMDRDIVRTIERSLKRLGVTFYTKSQARGWEEKDGKAVVTADTPEGTKRLPADRVLVTVGRRPNTDGLGLGKAGVQLDEGGYIVVDRQLRTNVSHILAIGDVVGQPFLAHRASKEGLVAAEVIAGRPAEVDYRALPAAVFTDPEIATVGVSEREAKEGGLRVRVGKFPLAASGRALTAASPEGFVKLLVDGQSGLILGASVVAYNASDLISEIALAMEMGATAEDLALTVHPHPTMPEAIMEAAEAAMGQAIHMINR
jgi:dihydrolipoamide dehydrogenase